MKLLIRLYPRAWRERYGEELSALLEDRTPGPFDALDLLLGAVDAHIHRRAVGIGTPGRDRMATTSRIGVIAATAGGALWVLTLALALWQTPALAGLVMTLIALTLSLFVVALGALSAVPGRSRDLHVWVSLLLPVVGVSLLVGGTAAQLAVGDRPLVGELTPYAFWIWGTFLAVVGCTLFGIVSAAAGGLTHASAALLSVGAIVQIVTLLMTDHARDEWLILLGAVAFGLGWIVVGLGAAHAERYRATDTRA
jgi:hypothetical protein